MHPAYPAIHHNSQLMEELPPSPDLSAHEGVRIQKAAAAAPQSVDDELASPGPSLLPAVTDAQPWIDVHTDSDGMAVTEIEDCRLLCRGNGDGDGVCGRAIHHVDDQIGHPSIAVFLGVLQLPIGKPGSLDCLPNEILLHVLGFLDVSDLLATSRTNHLLRGLSLSPILHQYRLQRTRQILPPLLWSAARPTVADLIARSIFLTHTLVVSRRLAWSLVSIRLSRRLAARPPAEVLVERCVLPKECVPGMSSVYVAPGLVAKRKAIEKERVKDGLRRWIAGKWKGEVREREEQLRRWHESRGIGRVWKLTKFWERVSRGDVLSLS